MPNTMLNNITIEPLQTGDSKSLVDLLCLCFGEDSRETAKKETAIILSDLDIMKGCFIAKINGQIVASVFYVEELMVSNALILSWVATHPNYRHQGISSQLLKHTCKHIAIKELHGNKGSLLLHTSSAHNLYQSLDFKRCMDSHKKNGAFYIKYLNS